MPRHCSIIEPQIFAGIATWVLCVAKDNSVLNHFTQLMHNCWNFGRGKCTTGSLPYVLLPTNTSTPLLILLHSNRFSCERLLKSPNMPESHLFFLLMCLCASSAQFISPCSVYSNRKPRKIVSLILNSSLLSILAAWWQDRIQSHWHEKNSRSREPVPAPYLHK